MELFVDSNRCTIGMLQFIPPSNIKIFKDDKSTPEDEDENKKIQPSSSEPLDTTSNEKVTLEINPNSPSNNR